jgi:predicted ester cyclase
VSVTEQNEAIVRRLVDEVMNAGRLEILDEIYTPKMASAARAWIAPFRVSFPDVHLQVVDLVVEGDEVVGRFLCSSFGCSSDCCLLGTLAARRGWSSA